MLTEERRQELVKHSRDVAEKARISIRNYRREANESIKKTVDDDNLSEDHKFAAEEDIQTLTNDSIKKVDKLLEKKEKEILTV
jgi:ribosome recycling factor